MGHAGVGWVMQGWGGSYRGGVDHTGVGQTRVGLVTKGWGGSCRGEVGHAGWGGSCRGGVRWVIQRQDGVGHKKYKNIENIKLLVLQGI